MIWVTGDLHFNDEKLISRCRNNFKTIEEHNNYIIEQYNSCVQEDDLVYILGDLGFKPYAKLLPLVKRLKGRKILVLGNHDQLTDGEYRSMGIIKTIKTPFYYSDHLILSHEPVKEAFNNQYVYNLHGHLHLAELNLPNYINVNIELNDFKPYNLKELDEEIFTLTKRRQEKFGEEWYKNYYKNVKK